MPDKTDNSPNSRPPRAPVSLPDPLPVRGILALPASLTWRAGLLMILAALLLAGSLLSLPGWYRSLQHLLKSNAYSDVHRQWACCLYLRNGMDPFRAANEALQRTYGPVQGPDRIRLKDTRIWSVNMTQYDANTPGLLPGTPPPEAGYPPSSLAICLALFGYLPSESLNAYWMGINLLCFPALIWFLAWPRAPAPLRRSIFSVLFLLAILLIWPTPRLVFAHGQFTFFSLLFALLALHCRSSRPWLASLLFSLALIKPALVLLFLIIPFLERNWRLFAGIAIFHGLATLLVAAMAHASPWMLLLDWMNICRYLLQGGYTFQEIYNGLGWENTWIQTLLTLAFFAYCLATCAADPRKRPWALFSFLCLANLMWTYHERHDFTLLAFPLAFGLLEWMAAPPSRSIHARWILWTALFFLAGIGLSTTAYANLQDASRAMRWAGRIGIYCAFVWLNFDLWLFWLSEVRAVRPSAIQSRTS